MDGFIFLDVTRKKVINRKTMNYLTSDAQTRADLTILKTQSKSTANIYR